MDKFPTLNISQNYKGTIMIIEISYKLLAYN